MAQDIIPVTLALTEGDVVTLWAPRWREHGEEWEAFLGDDDSLFVFADAADLAAWIRTAESAGTPHDLRDHPAWSTVGELSVDELTPEDVQRYDIVGVPELVAEDPDTWTVDELAETTAMLRSLAEVCDLAVIDEVLDEAEGFGLAARGTGAFSGRDGSARWDRIGEVVARRWDDVLDAVDAMVSLPEVDTDLAERLRATATSATPDETSADGAEPAAPAEDAGNDPVDPAAVAEDPLDSAVAGPEPDAPAEVREDAPEETPRSGLGDEEDAGPTGFWAEAGIDPIAIVTPDGEYYTLRCYLDDEPLFLGSDGRIDVATSPRALARWIAGDGADGHDLADVATWDDVVARATGGDLEVTVARDNHYVLSDIDEEIAEGPRAVDGAQLELAVELLTDAADWAGDPAVGQALAPSESLGWLVSFVLRPDPTRLTPSPPFDTEAAAWRALRERLSARLRPR